jgi:hypothetical protein
MEITNDVMLVDDEVCSRVAGDYISPIEIVNISPVSIVRWLEVSRTFNSTVSKSIGSVLVQRRVAWIKRMM